MGSEAAEFTPIPSPTLPLKGREKCSGALKLAHMRFRGNDGCRMVSVMNYVKINNLKTLVL
jgi:hypothetical protein